MRYINEKTFIFELWDLMNHNTVYMTQKKFFQRYGENFVEADPDKGTIKIKSEHGEYMLTLQTIWKDNE